MMDPQAFRDALDKLRPERNGDGFTIREAAKALGVERHIAARHLRKLLDAGALRAVMVPVVNDWGQRRTTNGYAWAIPKKPARR